MLIAVEQIEQFLETIYPSQDPKSIIQEPAATKDLTSKETKDKAEAAEAKSDLGGYTTGIHLIAQER